MIIIPPDLAPKFVLTAFSEYVLHFYMISEVIQPSFFTSFMQGARILVVLSSEVYITMILHSILWKDLIMFIALCSQDVSAKIMSFSHNGPKSVCILSANGAISNVTLYQAATSGGTVTYEVCFIFDLCISCYILNCRGYSLPQAVCLEFESALMKRGYLDITLKSSNPNFNWSLHYITTIQDLSY